MKSTSTLEIERKWLLRAMPQLPPGATTLHIEQGYLGSRDRAADDAGRLREGRLRRTTSPAGRVTCTHTVKSGSGLIRRERQREIAAEEFERDWPRTEGRRIIKLRHVVADPNDPELAWEIDEITYPVSLVLAEVELPDAKHEPALPPWLERVVEREVTLDPAWYNSAIALWGDPRRARDRA